jgi:hypothetical protein
MKALVLVFLGLVMFGASLSAEQAVISSLSGFVETRAPGAGWVPAQQGQVVTDGTMISTGFNSRAELNLGTATIALRPLTRLSLEDLVRQGNFVKTRLGLRIGRIHAEVKTAVGLSQDFRVVSPVSTAAVRGTGFIFDGQTLDVLHGLVAFSNRLDLQRLVGIGERSQLVGFHAPESAERGMEERFHTDVSTVPHKFHRGEMHHLTDTGSIQIRFQ